MKQLVILFVLLLYVTGSSDLLKSISKFGDGADYSSKFAKGPVSPFSDDSEEYDDDDNSQPQKHNMRDDDEDEIDVMAQLKSYQHQLSTPKDVKPPQEIKRKQPQPIEESESEYDYDDDDDSGNMWSRGISKKLSQTEQKPFVLPIENAKQQIKNDFTSFSNTKAPEIQTKQYDFKVEEKPSKIADDPEKERSSDFEKMKQAQLEKYSKKFHIDEPKETKSMYENDSLKEFMPKINFQPLNIQEAKATPQSTQPEKKETQQIKPQQFVEDSDSEDEDDYQPAKQIQSQPQKSNKNEQLFNTDAFDFLNKEKEAIKEKQQKQKKIVEPEIESESEDDDEEEEKEEPKHNDEEEKLILQKLANKSKNKKKQSQLVEKNFDYDNEQTIANQKKQKQLEDEQREKELLQKQKEEQEEQERLLKKQKQKQVEQEEEEEDDEEEEKKQKKKSKKQKKTLSLEEFQNSLMSEPPKQKQIQQSFAQTEQVDDHKDKKVLEQKTFTLVREDHITPQEQKQETKVFKVQAVPKKQQQLIQESESESESENEEEDAEEPKQINCFESKNKFIQQICQLCSSKVAYQVNQQNWQKIGMNNGFRQSFQPLIEFTFKSIGEIGSYYLSFKDHIVCLSAENLQKQTNVDKVLKHFTGNQLTDYNSPIDIPSKSQPINFLLSAEYDSLLNGFSCRRFQIAIKTDLKYRLSKKNDINVKQIIFYKNKLKLKYIGFIQINGIAHQASFDQEEGGEVTNLMITQLNLPKEQGIIANLVDKYIDGNFVTEMLENQDQMLADLMIQTHQREDEIGLTFNLRKRKGK